MKKLSITRKAHKQIRSMNKPDQIIIYEALETLAAWPDCRNIKALQGQSGYRLRIGNYRAMFVVDGDTILITEVKRRNEHTY